MRQIIIGVIVLALALSVLLLEAHFRSDSEQQMNLVISQLAKVDLGLPKLPSDQRFSSNEAIKNEQSIAAKNVEKLKAIDASHCPRRFGLLWAKFIKDYLRFTEVISRSPKHPLIGNSTQFVDWVDSSVRSGVDCVRDKELILNFGDLYTKLHCSKKAENQHSKKK